MTKQLPPIQLSGQTYKPTINVTKTAKFLLENFDNEAFDLSELVSDLEGQAVQTVFKFDENEKTYTLSFSGDKDEFSLIMGPIMTKAMIKENFVLLATQALNDRLKFEGVEFWETGHAWFHGMESTTVYSN